MQACYSRQNAPRSTAAGKFVGTGIWCHRHSLVTKYTETTLNELAAHLAPGTGLMGFDVGSKTLGLAISDTSLKIASPLTTLQRTKFTKDAVQLTTLIQKHGIGGLIFGLPLNMNGTEGPRAQSTRAFARNMRGFTNLPMCFWDERLSTVAATRTLLEADVSRQRRRAVIDKIAASFMLQGALDYLSRN